MAERKEPKLGPVLPDAGEDRPAPAGGDERAAGATGAAGAAGADQAAAPPAAPGGAPDRTISVETSQGTLIVRRVSLGALARIAHRMSATMARDETVLLDALVREVAGERRKVQGQSHEPAHTLTADRFAQLNDDDRRSIAAAVLTLEGIKAAGEGLVEDARDVLVKRYAPMLDTDPLALATLGGLVPGAADVASAGDVARAGGQLALFNLPPPPSMRRRADDPQPEGARAESAARTAARLQRTRLEDTVQRQGALIERQAMEREAAHAELTQLAIRVDAARTEARMYRKLAIGAAGIGLAVAVALGGYAISLRRDAAAQREAYEARIAEQQSALDRAAAARNAAPPAPPERPVTRKSRQPKR